VRELGFPKAAALIELSQEEQVRRVAREAAGGNRGTQNAAAPARAKTRPARMIAGLTDAFRDGSADSIPRDVSPREAFLAALTYTAGGESAEWLAPIVAKQNHKDASS
jgi:hypothetical protein